MSHHQIKNRWTDAVIYEGEAESLKDLVGSAVKKNISLRGANLGGANLGDAYLCGANLGGAYLRGANLGGANLCGANLGGAYLCGANLGGAYLRGANLGGANLCGAYLCGANLGGAYLRGANLGGANLCGANLGGAYLCGANHLISFSGIGSARRNTSYWLEADKVWCGCFTGTLEEFRAQVKETHKENPQYLAEYQAGIAFLEVCIAAIPEEEKEAGRKAYAEMIAKPELAEPKGMIK